MFSRLFHPDRFLRSVYGTDPFVDYCRERQISFEQKPATPLQTGDLRRWAAALSHLPHEQHAQVELELATVNEMADDAAVAHLIAAAGTGRTPPDAIAGAVPVALWYFVHHPDLFHEVFLHHEIREIASWRTGQAPPGLDLADLDGRTTTLAEVLREFFRVHEGTGRFCTADARRLSDAYCFVAQVADRLQFFDVFTDNGKTARHLLRPAVPVMFVYYPRDGTVLLQSHLRSRDRIFDLFQCFGQWVLGSPVTCAGDAFDLEPLKRPFHPLPDSTDMETVRVKTLHLRYPERDGRRLIKLETRESDDPSAIPRLLQAHVREKAMLDTLRVCHAELQVTFRSNGSHVIRLWPNRSNLTQSPLGERLRTCLQRWGLTHVRP